MMAELRKAEMMKQIASLALCAIMFIGCRKQDQNTASSESLTQAAFNPSSAPTVQFTVPDMMCPEGCGEKVKEILSQQPGAKDVVVDFDSKTVTVAVDKEKFDSKQAIAALVDHQFSHAALKDAGGAAAAPAAIQ